MNSKFYFFLLFLLLLPIFTFAQDPVYLVGIPGVDIGSDFNTYINALYKLSIAIAALLAVIKIIVAGLKWMLTDLITSKEDAKKDIQGAVLGLLIIIAAVIILETINPQLTKTQIFLAPAESIDTSQASQDKKAADCVLKYGSINTTTGLSPWNDATGICTPTETQVKQETGVAKRELACVDEKNKPDGCASAKDQCESIAGTVSPSYSLTGAVQDWRIICTPQAVIDECTSANGGPWDWNIDKALCVKAP